MIATGIRPAAALAGRGANDGGARSPRKAILRRTLPIVVGAQRLSGFGSSRPPVWSGLAVSLLAVAAATLLVYPLRLVAPVLSLSVVYLPGVILVAALWGMRLSLAASLLSALAFNFFHIPPTGRFTIAASGDWVGLAAFTLVAIVVSSIAELARSRAVEAERRRVEADLAASLARELLAGGRTRDALEATSRRLAAALRIPPVSIELGVVAGLDRHAALPLRDGEGAQIATLLVPSGLPPDAVERLRSQVIPALEALVAIALHRDAMQAEAVETEALRRSDELKTALLRSVSHDLRTPITSVVAAGHALGVRSLTEEERADLSSAVVEEGERLSRLVDKLLDLSRLQSGRALPRSDWVAIEEVLLDARDRVGSAGAPVRLVLEPDLPPLLGDAAQLEQVFTNLLENAQRYAGGESVSVHACRVESRLVVRVIDHGPGIGAGERERIFEPFYRGAGAATSNWTGSGLGLAIARGFAEANGGRISVESVPGQGTSFAVELPLPDPAGVAG
jgi:two-component system sensor histidine kinase KdpD